MKTIEERYKATKAKTTFEVTCDCPYCGAEIDIVDKATELFVIYNQLYVDKCDIEITCETCKKVFVVVDIQY